MIGNKYKNNRTGICRIGSKLNPCFYFKFPNRSKMSLVLRVFRAPELENTRHNVNS
jgi:hypothetical protein